jgi:hypothetical protein
MRKRPVGELLDDGASSFLEYLLLVVLVIAAAIAGMTFLGPTPDTKVNNTSTPIHQTVQSRVAAAGVSHSAHAFYVHHREV